MKLNQAIKMLVATLALAAVGSVMATPVIGLAGTDNGFDNGLIVGDAIFYGNLGSPAGDGTDEWLDGGTSVQIASNWAGTLISATLEMVSGGWGADGLAKVIFNGQLIGYLTAAFDNTTGDSFVVKDVFDLTPYLALISGNDSLAIVTFSGLDGGALDYAKLLLQILDAGGGGNNVPEPATLALVGLALAGVSLQWRRRCVTRPQYIQTRAPSRFE